MQRVNLRQQSELLAESFRCFAEATDLEALVTLVLERLSALSGGLCLVRLFGEAPRVYHPDPERLYRFLPFVESVASYLDKNLQEAGAHALLASSHFEMPDRCAFLLPLSARGRARGYAALLTEHTFSDEEASFLRELAYSAALCLDNALLLVAERGARRKAESELEESRYRGGRLHAQSAEASSHLLGRICHDLNNQISIVLSCSSLLVAEVLPDTSIRDDLFEIARAAERAASLSKQLFLFSRQLFQEAQASAPQENTHQEEPRS